IDCGLHIVANDSSVFAARRHRTRILISQRDLLVLALHHLGIDRAEPRDLFVQFHYFVLEMRNLCLWHRISTAVSGLQLCDVARDALLDPLQTPFHLGLSEVLVPRIDGFELRSVDGNARCTEQTELVAQRDELTAHLTNGLA